MTDVERLRKAIRDLHGVDSHHLFSEPVHEAFQGQTVWEGVVEVFALKWHPQAGLASAWSHETDEGGDTLRCSGCRRSTARRMP